MKFGKQIQNQAIPEWNHHYMNYKGLKKIIGQVAPSPNGLITVASTSHALSTEPTKLETTSNEQPEPGNKPFFFFRLERELEKVNAFYLIKESELKARARSLLDKKRVLSSKQQTVPALGQLRALRSGFIQFQQDLNKLQQFVEINATGFRKILKKWDKRSRTSTKELYLTLQVEKQPCFNQDIVAELSDSMTTGLNEIDQILEGHDEDEENPPSPSQFATSPANDLEAELYQALCTGQPQLVQEVLDRRQHIPNKDNIDFISPVVWRAFSESRGGECLDLLVRTTLPNFSYIDDLNHRTCLHEASINGQLDLVKLAVEKNNPINRPDIYGRTPLHYIAMYGYEECAQNLLAHKADINAIDHEGFTPLLYTITSGHPKLVNLFLDYESDQLDVHPSYPQALLLACQFGHPSVVKTLLSKKTPIEFDPDGLGPLHLACRGGHHEVAKLLTEHDGIDLDRLDRDHGWTPLFYAASEGHTSCVEVLLASGCHPNPLDENGSTPLEYAAIQGHVDCVQLLLDFRTSISKYPPKQTPKQTTPPNEEEFGQLSELDQIPSLSLPPPIIPFRIYGHNYLEQRHLIQIRLGHLTPQGTIQPPVHLYGNARLSSLKLIITPKPDNGLIPQNIILPLVDEREVYHFEIENLNDFSLEFELFPTFGSKVIGKAAALPSNFKTPTYLGKEDSDRIGSRGKCTCPLFDTHLKVVGEMFFEFEIIKPFDNVHLEIGGQIETYWKATNQTPVSSITSSNLHSNHPNTPPTSTMSFITASSLAQQYLQLVIQVTKDLVPVVYPEWLLSSAPFSIPVSHITSQQFTSMDPNPELTKQTKWDEITDMVKLREKLHSSYLTLEEVLRVLPSSVGLNIDLKYPTDDDSSQLPLGWTHDINEFVDCILKTIYKVNKGRSIIFSCFNPLVCNSLNWKQPNYAVFLNTFAGWKSLTSGQPNWKEDIRQSCIKETVKFCKRNNLLGVMCHSTPLVEVPEVVRYIKQSGLILASFGDLNQISSNLTEQYQNGVDATMVNGIISYGGGRSSTIF